jgi:hypothetical protein
VLPDAPAGLLHDIARPPAPHPAPAGAGGPLLLRGGGGAPPPPPPPAAPPPPALRISGILRK